LEINKSAIIEDLNVKTKTTSQKELNTQNRNLNINDINEKNQKDNQIEESTINYEKESCIELVAKFCYKN